MPYAPFDSLSGHGYGRLGRPRGIGGEFKGASLYPYREPPAHSDDEFEEEQELDDEEFKTDIKLFFNDPSERGQGRVDRGSFAGSSTRGLGEMTSLPKAMNGITPFPEMYDDIEAPIGGLSLSVSSPAPQTFTGTKHGFSSAPFVPWEEETFYDLHDLPLPDERALIRAQSDHAELVAETILFFRRYIS